MQRVVDSWAKAGGSERTTHYRHTFGVPELITWIVEMDTVKKYFAHGKRANRLKAELWLRFG